MAYRTRGRSSRARSTTRRPARSARRTSSRYSSAGARPARRAARRTAGLARTIRIVVETPSSNPLARPDMIGVKPDLVRKSNRSQF